jgi:hypothetical protein
MNRLRTVAYIPAAKQSGIDDRARQSGGQLLGHAVLVALAADEIAVHPVAKIGVAGA